MAKRHVSEVNRASQQERLALKRDRLKGVFTPTEKEWRDLELAAFSSWVLHEQRLAREEFGVIEATRRLRRTGLVVV
jgi:hypothetical protein